MPQSFGNVYVKIEAAAATVTATVAAAAAADNAAAALLTCLVRTVACAS